MRLRHNNPIRNKLLIEQSPNASNILRNTLFLALFTLALHLFLITLDTSVLMKSIPELLLESYFSTFTIYNLICMIFISILFITQYNQMTFAAVNENKWYNFIKAGYSPFVLIFMKLGLRIVEVTIAYSIGFACVFIFTTFLKYPLTISYIIPLYLVGVTDLLVLVIIVMVISLFAKNTYKRNGRFVIIAVYCSMQVLRVTSGYYKVISDRTLMTNVASVIDPALSKYFIYVAIIAILSIVFVIYKARKASSYANFYFYQKDMDFDEDASIVLKVGNTFQAAKNEAYVDEHQHHKVFDIMINVGMTSVILLLVFFNIIVLAVSLTSLNRNWNFLNIYPYVFASDTMAPTLEYNDLAFFEGVDSGEAQLDDIVLFRSSDSEVAIARLVEKNEEVWIVDYDKYPEETDPELLREKINPNQIEGVFMSASHWLGLLVMFANTMMGRVIMLILPSILIFFYDPIVRFIERLKKSR